MHPMTSPLGLTISTKTVLKVLQAIFKTITSRVLSQLKARGQKSFPVFAVMTVTARQEQSKLEQQPVLSVVLTMKVVVCATGVLEGPTSLRPTRKAYFCTTSFCWHWL